LGLRIKNGWSYHGLALNVRMDLQPFELIDPCGYEGLAVTQIADLVDSETLLLQDVSKLLCDQLLIRLGYQMYYKQ